MNLMKPNGCRAASPDAAAFPETGRGSATPPYLPDGATPPYLPKGVDPA